MGRHCARCSSDRFKGHGCLSISARTTIVVRFHRWRPTSRVGGGRNQDGPYVPLSHPFVEWLVETLRRECLDRTLFWTTADLEAKLREFQKYFNAHRTHAGLEACLADSGGPEPPISFASDRWRKHCRGLYQPPIAA